MEMRDVGGGGDERGMYLVWEDVSVVVPNFGNGHTRRLLDGLSGYAEPGRIMAIMGPSGSGKSTLLDALAGSLSLSLSLSKRKWYSVHAWLKFMNKLKHVHLDRSFFFFFFF
jgi:ABC-type uncharacterized transport system YnjBCD ATPase subunit